MNLNELRDRAYKNACEHGFHDKDLGNDCYLMLVITELSEAVEADRKGKLGLKCKSRFEKDYNEYPNSVEEWKRFKQSFVGCVKDTVPDELADAVIRLLDLAGLRNVDLSHVYTCNTIDIIDFPVFVFRTIRWLYNIPIDCAIKDVISNIFSYCKSENIDLLWHIETKMKYNELREYKHGKKY